MIHRATRSRKSSNKWAQRVEPTQRERKAPWHNRFAEQAGIPAERIVIAGFSQGACLATEFVASYPKRYAALLAFTGGLVGPLGADLTHTGNLAGTPAMLACGDPDPHIPWERVEQSAEILRGMGAEVTTHRYPGRPHTISPEEIELGEKLVKSAFASMGPVVRS